MLKEIKIHKYRGFKDVPTLDTLADKGYVYKNYFFRFAILLVIDEVFVRMYRRYREMGLTEG